MDKWVYNYLTELQTLWKKEKLLVTSNFTFSHNVFRRCLLLMSEHIYGGKVRLVAINSVDLFFA